MTVLFHISSNSEWEFQFLQILSGICYLILCEAASRWGFDFCFPDDYWLWVVFHVLLANCISSLEECVIRSHYFNWNICFLILCYKSFHSVPDISGLSNIWFGNGLCFHFLDVSFAAKKSAFNFDTVWFMHFYFVTCAFDFVYNKTCKFTKIYSHLFF